MHNMKSCFSVALVFSCLVVATNGFFQNAGKKASVNSPLVQEVIEIYGNKYPYDRAPRKDNAFDAIGKIGVPKTDIDGSKIMNETKNPKRRITDMSETQVAATFRSMAAVYGEERAIEMVKINPFYLTFDPKAFAPTFAIWSDIFGEEETKDMVSRNPGLLAVQPKDAGTNTDNTMKASYIIAATRPIGIFGPAFIGALLMIPVIEGTTGIAIQKPFFAALGFDIQ